MLKRIAMLVVAGMAAATLAACGSQGGSDSADAGAPGGGGDDAIVMGFSQVGAESGWRTANTKSIEEAAKEAGITLRFSDAQQKQENQIKAIRSYIQQKVDVIAFSPVVESGWDTVLKEAKDANIPVILTDRAVDSADTSLYRTFLGSDFVEEGKKAGQWLVEEYKDSTDTVNIVELQGTTGSAPANDRKAGFAEVIGADSKFKIIASQTGDFTRAKGKEVMEAFLKANPDIDVLWAHNEHLARNPEGWGGPTMGHVLHASLGSRYYPVGVLCGDGECRAVDPSTGSDDYTAVPLPPLRPGTTEAALRELGRTFVTGEEFDHPGPRRFIGWQVDTSLFGDAREVADTFEVARPSSDFAALAFLPESTADIGYEPA